MTTQFSNPADAPQNTRTVPLSYRCYRGAVVLTALLILLFAGLGAAGYGPLHALEEPTSTTIDWVKTQMRTSE